MYVADVTGKRVDISIARLHNILCITVKAQCPVAISADRGTYIVLVGNRATERSCACEFGTAGTEVREDLRQRCQV